MVYHHSIKLPDMFSISSGKTLLSVNNNSIVNCLSLLLTTSKGELMGDPKFGSNLMKLIYEPNDSVLRDMVTEDIVNTISTYEPRITVNNVNIIPEDNEVHITISYFVNNTGEYEDFKISVNRE